MTGVQTCALPIYSQDRLERNPLRILDSKDPRDQAFVAGAPKIDDFLSGEAQDFFGAVTSGLDAAGVTWTRAPALVRGLDYYRHTAFEFVTDRLGAQGTVLGGGRYDGLMESLGGPPTPAVGWAAGIERLAMLVEKPALEPAVAVIADKTELEAAASRVRGQFRQLGVPVHTAFRGSAKRQAEIAHKADVAGIVYIRSETDGIPEINFSVSKERDDGLLFQSVQLWSVRFGRAPKPPHQ